MLVISCLSQGSIPGLMKVPNEKCVVSHQLTSESRDIILQCIPFACLAGFLHWVAMQKTGKQAHTYNRST